MKVKTDRLLKLTYLTTLVLILIVCTSVILVSVFGYHIVSGTNLDPYAKGVNIVTSTRTAKRGNIYDANGSVVAQDIDTYDVVCFLSKNRISAGNRIAYVDDPLTTAKVLADILGADEATLYGYLTQDLYQTEIGPRGRNISKDLKEQIESYKLNGVEFRKSVRRNYFLSDFSPYLIGFAQTNEDGVIVGKMGVEAYLNSKLTGTNGKETYQSDKNGYILDGMVNEVEYEINGNDVYLTIDQDIQEALTVAFQETKDFYNSNTTWGTVVEIDTGKILAWGQTPSFDSNTLNIETYLNYGSQYAYEPGSTFKPIIYAAAIETGNYNGDATFDSTRFCYVSTKNGNPIRTYSGNQIGCIQNADGKSWGMLSFDDGLVKSSNVATSTLLSSYVAPETFLDYVKKFGFTEKVETDGIPESLGTYNFNWASEKLAMTFGQGISVTMLQMVQAYTAIFGDGNMVKPYFIERVVDSYDNSVVYEHGGREIVSRPIQESTARHLQTLLRKVIQDGGIYDIDEVELMGKTGTAQVATEYGTYDAENMITSVMLAFPAEHPKYLLYYAFDAKYNRNNHYWNQPVRNLAAKISKLLAVNTVEIKDAENMVQINEYDMPEFKNHSISYAENILNSYGCDTYILGDGDNIISQYPEVGSKVYTNQKVFVLTDGAFFKMPDMTGWSREEVVGFWQCTGCEMVINGKGLVTKQSISKNVSISNTAIIEVILEDLKSERKQEEPITEE